jgi:hypothetical protein
LEINLTSVPKERLQHLQHACFCSRVVKTVDFRSGRANALQQARDSNTSWKNFVGAPKITIPRVAICSAKILESTHTPTAILKHPARVMKLPTASPLPSFAMAPAPLIPEVNRAGSTSSPLQIRSPAINRGTPFPHASYTQGKKFRLHKNFTDP